jgi:hypothetical protein
MKMLRKVQWLLALLALVAVPQVAGQEGDAPLELRLRRDFGYGSGLQVQGRFSMRVTAPDNVERVEFLVDDQVIGEDGEAPFVLQFSTGNYADGWHNLQAIGYAATGETLPSNVIRREFVPARTANLATIAIIGVVLVIVVLRFAFTRNDAKANYGLVGGTICPRCGRPFAYHGWSFALLVGRLDRCRHCGKWSFTQRVSPEHLAALERELDGGAGEEEVVTSEEERLRRELESSRYEDVP